MVFSGRLSDFLLTVYYRLKGFIIRNYIIFEEERYSNALIQIGMRI
jgi:hypothetical protein